MLHITNTKPPHPTHTCIHREHTTHIRFFAIFLLPSITYDLCSIEQSTPKHRNRAISNITNEEVNTLVTFLILSDFNQMYWERILKHTYVCDRRKKRLQKNEKNKMEIRIEQWKRIWNKDAKSRKMEKKPQINSHHRNHWKIVSIERSQRNAITRDSDCDSTLSHFSCFLTVAVL